MSDVPNQLRQYVEATIERLDVDDVVAALEGNDVRPPRPHRAAAVFAAAFAAAIIVIGGVFWLIPRSNDPATAPSATLPSTASPAPQAGDSSGFGLVPVAGVEAVVVETAIGNIEFTTYRVTSGDRFVFFNDIAVTAHGPVAVDGETLWWSADYENWHQIGRDLDATWITLVGDEVVTGGETTATRLAWTGHEWTEQAQVRFPGPIRGPIAVGAQGAVAIRADGAAIYYSADGVGFDPAERGPDTGSFVAATDVPPEDRDFGDCRATFGASRAEIRIVLATDAGFTAFTSATHPYGDVCAPLLWYSSDGNEWELLASASPFGSLSVVNDVAGRSGRFGVIGEVGGQGEAEIEAAAWFSDDAVTWRRADVEPFVGLTHIEAGEPGWMLGGLGRAADIGSWAGTFSLDGLTWDGPHDLPIEPFRGYFRTLIGIGPHTVLAYDPAEEIFVVGRMSQIGGDSR
jgi:hypothetical protein